MLLVQLSSDWGSENPAARLLIRQSILDKVEGQNSDLLDLKKIPKLANYNVSISHTQKIGGFVLAPNDLAVGLDIEERHRVTEKIIRRISKGEELQNAPAWDYLWVAKEATFKALKHLNQPQMISEIQITKWQKNEDKYQFFYEHESRLVIGYVYNNGNISVALAFLVTH